jgi:hypothetical protein
MRCYLMQNGHIRAVEFLTPGPDESLIEQGKSHFASKSLDAFEGFEVWDGARRVYVYPEVTKDLQRIERQALAAPAPRGCVSKG